jgi:hypothetical protein
MKPIDMNELRVPDDVGHTDTSDYSTRSTDGSIAVYFREIEKHLTQHIAEAQTVVGCVAWLTSEVVLNALAHVPHGVSIVVQKEDFLRPDLETHDGWKNNLRRMYESLKELPGRNQMPGLVAQLSYLSDQTIQAVRCVGNYNREKKPAFPRMHNKFLVFCRVCPVEVEGYTAEQVQPYAVWTGSFNLTKNAGMSLENAVLITDPAIVNAYYCEWGQIMALSESLDWESDWSAPEWRIGS